MENKNNTFSLQIHFFPGFYDSIFENCDTEYNLINDEKDYIEENYGVTDIAEDDIILDYKTRRQDIAETFMEYYKDYCPDFVKNINNVTIDSPMYYNFRTDELYADFELTDDWKEKMLKFMGDNEEWLKKEIKENWSSYDGFMSFISNDLIEWNNKLFVEEDTRYIDIMIAYMILAKNPNISESLAEYTYEDICDTEYLSYSEVLTEKINAAMKENA